MATVKEITHDSSTTIGDFYSSVTDIDGAIIVSAAAALGDSVNGVNMDFGAGGNSVLLVESFTALIGTDFRWRLRLNFANVSNFGGMFVQFELETTASMVFRIFINATTISLQYHSDSGGSTNIDSYTLNKTDEICIDVRAIRETADGNADGEIELFENGVSKISVSNLDNFIRWNLGIDNCEIVFQSGGSVAGNLYYDEWILSDDSAIPLCEFGGYNLVLGGGLP